MLSSQAHFFRDSATLERLAARVLPELIEHAGSDRPLRVWVPGCATGEEAYSIAMLLAEQTAAAGVSGRVQVFASDIDQEAVEFARAGVYARDGLAQVPSPRLERFFSPQRDRYTVVESIRKVVWFAVQSLVHDPPFARLDLIVCRAVLGSLKPDVRRKVFHHFHFALNENGFLVLGDSGDAAALDEWFVRLSGERDTYRRRTPSFRRLNGAGCRSIDAHASVPLDLVAEREFLTHFAPSGVVVKRSGRIRRVYGTMDRYLSYNGLQGLDLVDAAREPLRMPLRTVLAEAARENRVASIECGGDFDSVEPVLRITVRPVSDPSGAETEFLAVFENVPASPRAQLAREHATKLRASLSGNGIPGPSESGASTGDDATGSAPSFKQELRASNEELRVSNEELRASNEHLLTTREELQLMNEELAALNARVQANLEEITKANDDLANLYIGSDVAAVIVDADNLVKRVTPAATRILGIGPEDYGQPLAQFTTTLIDVNLPALSQMVLSTHALVEREILTRDDHQYILRVIPYLTSGHAVEGAIVTLVDVTSLKRAQEDLAMANRRVSEDFRRMSLLQSLSSELAGPVNLPMSLHQIVRTALQVTGADKGDVQVLDSADVLTVAAHEGFEPPVPDYFRLMDSSSVSARSAGPAGRRVAVEDIARDAGPLDAQSVEVLMTAGVRALQSTLLVGGTGKISGVFSTHFASPHRFTDDDMQWLDLLAHQAELVIERGRTETLLERSKGELEERVQVRTKWLALLHAVTRTINDAATWDEALFQVLRHICDAEEWQLGYVYLPDRGNPNIIVPMVSYGGGRFEEFHLLSLAQRYARGDLLPGCVYLDGAACWITSDEEMSKLIPARHNLARKMGLKTGVALPIAVGRQTTAVLELFSDRVHEPSEELSALMNDVSHQIGRVLERERATAQMADLVWRQQQELLHTLHDSLGQTLTGLGMLSSALRQRLSSIGGPGVELTQQIARQAQEALDQVRRLSKGLLPVDIRAEELMTALHQLGSTIESLYPVEVRVQGNGFPTHADGIVATQLYRIAQEAVTNSIKHSRASVMGIEVFTESGLTTLRVSDDGIGVPGTVTEHAGLGLRIMQYRASSIGAQISIEQGMGGGTVVTCTLRAGGA